MKFYFCEMCGKRVTDLDIHKGAGRDKKLKGVYCSNCAVGVTTMAEMPVVGEAPPKTKPASGEFGFQRRKLSESASDREPVSRQAGKPFPVSMIALSGSGLVVLTVVAFFVLGRQNPRHGEEQALVTPPALEVRAPAAPIAPPVESQPVALKPTPPLQEKPLEEKTQASAPLENFVAEVQVPLKLPDPPADAPAKTSAPAVKTEAPVQQQPVLNPAAVSNGHADAELLSKVIGLIAQRQVPEALAMIGKRKDGGDAPRQALIAALTAIQKDDKALQEQLAAQVGQRVKLQTAKETVEGKLIAVDFPVLRVEKSISMNGESIGSTTVSSNAYDLNEASRQSLYRPADPDANAWAGRVLTALGFMHLTEAENALTHLADHPLRETLAAELKQRKILDLEAQAKAAWTAITARAKETPTQSRAKQLSIDLEVFEKNFGSTEFASSPGVSVPLKEMKERMERLATGLDPRVMSLFKGRVLSYDAPSAVITLEYDFSTRQQTDDFIGSTWAAPGDQTGLTWTKGKLATFCKNAHDFILTMPQFASNSLNVQIEYTGWNTGWQKASIGCGFYGVNSTAKSPKVRIEWGIKTCDIFTDSNVAKSVPSNVMTVKQGKFEFSCQDRAVTVKLNGATIVEHTLAKPNDHAGFWFGGGWDSGTTLTRLQVSGRLDPVWLAAALKAAK